MTNSQAIHDEHTTNPGMSMAMAAALPIGKPFADIDQTVDARQLHVWLNVGRDFSTWVKEQVESCRLLEGRDFEVIPETGGNPAGGRPRIGYVLSIDGAKHIAMSARSERGYQAREYFIAAERELRSMFGRPSVLQPRPIIQPPRPSAAREREARLRSKEQRLTRDGQSRHAKLLLEVAREQRNAGDVEGAKNTLDVIVRMVAPAAMQVGTYPPTPALTVVPKGGAA
jgi:phage anti-repressor protein